MPLYATALFNEYPPSSEIGPACSHAGGLCTFPWSRIGLTEDIPRARRIVKQRMRIDRDFEK